MPINILPSGFGAPQGLLGYNPRAMQMAGMKRGLLNAGINMLSQGPSRYPTTFGQLAGGALQGYQEGSEQGKQDYWSGLEQESKLSEYTRKMQKERDQQAAFEKILPSLPQDLQAAAAADPEGFYKIYTEESVKSKFNKAKTKWSKLDDYTLFNEDTGETKPVGSGAADGQVGRYDPEDVKKVLDLQSGSAGFKAYEQTAPILESMYKSLGDPSAAANLDFAVGVGKILDPLSVVRESEVGLVLDSQSIPQQIQGQINKMLQGKGMSPELKGNLYKLAHRRVSELRGQSAREQEHLSGLAPKMGVPVDVLRQTPELAPAINKWANQNMEWPGSAAQTGAVIENEADIPEGTVVENEQGQRFIKRNGALVPVK